MSRFGNCVSERVIAESKRRVEKDVTEPSAVVEKNRFKRNKGTDAFLQIVILENVLLQQRMGLI
jgi:hypothetical protein